MPVTPIFATQHDTEKPITYTLERALQADENLRLYVFEVDGEMVEYDSPTQQWNEYAGTTGNRNGAQNTWTTIAVGTTLTLFLECDELFTARGNGTFFLNVGIYDYTAGELEMVDAGVLVLQNSLKPGQ